MIAGQDRFFGNPSQVSASNTIEAVFSAWAVPLFERSLTMRRQVTILLCGVLCAAMAAPAAWGQGEPGVAVTVYNQGYAVVKEDRVVEIPNAESIVRFTDVAQRIDPTSVYFKSLTDPNGTGVLEQNYEYDLVSADKLLAKYIDRPLSVWTTNGKKYEGTLLSFDAAQLVLKTAEASRWSSGHRTCRTFSSPRCPRGC
jgi:hypothetical protein